MNDEDDIRFMKAALALAEQGRGSVSPNPLVGALVVKDGVIVGKGYHRKAGTEHAEVLALRDAGVKACGATLYVTLEPCCHHGKTPPCTDAVKASGVSRVVAAMADPNPLMCGNGFVGLTEDGIETIVGICEHEARIQNEVFIKYIQTKHPFVTLKLAATLDGRIAAMDGSSKWITGDDSRRQIHRLRSWNDAVMVGIGTVKADNPSLTVRAVEGNNPLRIVIDPHLEVPLESDVAGNNTVICSLDTADFEKERALRERGAAVWRFTTRNGWIPLDTVMDTIGKHGITSVLCEGGSSLASGLLREHLADKLVYMLAPVILGNGIPSFEDIGIGSMNDALRLSGLNFERYGDDMAISGYPVYEITSSTY
jgi:diaminohydroxyphosphoribosylaminopyrimidine deaminase / 5-amino-6-(5-phosphoribosylamino)uracil reductase